MRWLQEHEVRNEMLEGVIPRIRTRDERRDRRSDVNQKSKLRSLLPRACAPELSMHVAESTRQRYSIRLSTSPVTYLPLDPSRSLGRFPPVCDIDIVNEFMNKSQLLR